jgi:S1-C subfamily serine protease
MCGLGACGCEDLGTEMLIDAWRDAVPVESELPGFVLLAPRAESELARAGVSGGELILAVDDQRVFHRDEIQTAIRRHALGDELRLLIQRASETPREIRIRHVSDYPKS